MNERQEVDLIRARQASLSACRGVLAILYHLRSQIPEGQEKDHPFVDAIRDIQAVLNF